MFVTDRILRFVQAIETWDEDCPKFESLPRSIAKVTPGDPKDCIYLSRNCDLDELESEDDEKYRFSTVDRQVISVFNRFEIRPALQRACPGLKPDHLEHVIHMVWAYPIIMINRVTGEFEPISELSADYVAPAPPRTGGPPIKVIYTD